MSGRKYQVNILGNLRLIIIPRKVLLKIVCEKFKITLSGISLTISPEEVYNNSGIIRVVPRKCKSKSHLRIVPGNMYPKRS